MEEIIEHHGVKGQKWGVRRKLKDFSTDRTAKKDAKRFADAKMYYGKGAGTRRKLLKAELNKKRSTIEGYGDKFDKHLASTDMSKSAKKAVRERKTRDTAHHVRVDTRKILNVTGGTLAAAGAAYYLQNKPQVDRAISAYSKVAVNAIKKQQTQRAVNQIFKNAKSKWG